MTKLKNNLWFKCITVLLLISIISGGLLAILNDILYVSPSERTSRAIKKIYGTSKEYSTILDVDNGYDTIEYDFGRINKIFKVENDYLFQTVGYNGYKNGTITVWVQYSISNDSITKVLLESYEKQTLMSKLGNDYYSKFIIVDVTEKYKNNENFSTDLNSELGNAVSGASYSANAGNNAVNCVIRWIGENNE